MSEKEMLELDAWCAEHVMEWKKVAEDVPRDKGVYFCVQRNGEVNIGTPYKIFKANHSSHEWRMFAPTTDPAAAIEVLKNCIEDLGGDVLITRPHYSTENMELWTIRNGDFGETWAKSETLELAICLFAKKLFSN